MQYDVFELRQAAIECAQRCVAQGWIDVIAHTMCTDYKGESFAKPMELEIG